MRQNNIHEEQRYASHDIPTQHQAPKDPFNDRTAPAVSAARPVLGHSIARFPIYRPCISSTHGAACLSDPLQGESMR